MVGAGFGRRWWHSLSNYSGAESIYIVSCDLMGDAVKQSSFFHLVDEKLPLGGLKGTNCSKSSG